MVVNKLKHFNNTSYTNLKLKNKITTESEYKWYLAKIEEVFNSTPGSEEYKILLELSKIVEIYENEHYFL